MMISQPARVSAEKFSALLERVDANSVSRNKFCVSYLQYLLQHKNYYSLIYATVIEAAIAKCTVKKEEATFVDYGCGNGLLGAMALFAGFKKVFLIDADKDRVEAAQNLCAALGLSPEAVIHGKTGALKEVQADIVAGTDVVEHIYDLDDFFETISRVNPEMVTVFTTASNTGNILKSRKLQRSQIADELHGSKDNIQSEGNKSFLSMRSEILQSHCDFSPQEVEVLAKHTRGLYLPDILKAAERYKNEEILPPLPTHKTNTCHPYTGSWTERLLTHQEYISIYKKHGFDLCIAPGFYDSTKQGAKGVVNRALNLAVRAVGTKLSPFITLIGYRK